MKTPAVKGLFAAAAAVLLAAMPIVGRSVTIDVTKFQQRYPWNGLVDIDYTISRSGGESELDPVKHSVRISVVNRAETPAVTNVAHVFRQGALPVSDGTHRVTWDANAEGINFKSQDVIVFAEVVHYAEKYMVIDVSGGSETNCYPVDFLNGAPSNGFSDPEYKSNKIVLRHIHPGSYIAGSPSSPAEANRTAAREKQHSVALSQPFYIGIYEITQKQYVNVMGTNPSANKGDYRPVESVSYNTIRGTSDTSNHTYDWPWNDNVDPNSFMGKLRDKCKAKDSSGNYTVSVEGFDLPTEFQWEYACRAGTTGAFNTTNAYNSANSAEQEAQLKLLGRYNKNQADGKGDYNANHTNVGSYQPNQWGLYDMHGNVWEWCRDWFQEDATALKQFTDPKGADSGLYRIFRGGSWNYSVGDCRSAYRGGSPQSNLLTDLGFRLSRTLP